MKKQIYIVIVSLVFWAVSLSVPSSISAQSCVDAGGACYIGLSCATLGRTEVTGSCPATEGNAICCNPVRPETPVVPPVPGTSCEANERFCVGFVSQVCNSTGDGIIPNQSRNCFFSDQICITADPYCVDPPEGGTDDTPDVAPRTPDDTGEEVSCDEVAPASFSFFDTISGLLASFVKPLTNDLNWQCANTLTDEIDETGRPAGRPFCGQLFPDSVEVAGVEGSKPGSLIDKLFHADLLRGGEIGGGLGDYTYSKQYGVANSVNPSTIEAYQGGPQSDSAKTVCPLIDTKDQFANCTGVVQRLSPYTIAVPVPKNEGVFIQKKYEDVQKERVLAAIIRGYGCELSKAPSGVYSRFASMCRGEITHDQKVGYVTSANTAVWMKPTSGDFRPHMAVEFACMNDEFITEDLGRGEIKGVCSVVMGPDFASGEIADATILGAQTAYRGGVCTLDCKYDTEFGMWNYMSITRKDDIPIQIGEKINPKEADEPQNIEWRDSSLPGALSVLESGKMVKGFIAPKTKVAVQALAKNAKCTKESVGAKNTSEKIPKTIFEEIVYFARDLFNGNDPPSDGTKTVKRTGSVFMNMTVHVRELVADCPGEAGWCRMMLPKKTADSLSEDAGGGVPFKELTSEIESMDCGPDFDCKNVSGIAAVGGPQLTLTPNDSLISDAVLPYDPTKTSSVTKWLTAAASDIEVQTLVQTDPFSFLKSFATMEEVAKKISN